MTPETLTTTVVVCVVLAALAGMFSSNSRIFVTTLLVLLGFVLAAYMTGVVA